MDESGDQEKMENMDDIAVYQIHAGDGDGADMIFDFNGQRMSVSVTSTSAVTQDNCGPETSQYSLKNCLLKLISRATSADLDDEEYEAVVDEALALILDAGRPLFAQAAPLGGLDSQSLDSDPSLHSLIFPTTLAFRCVGTADGTASVVPIDRRDAYTRLTAEPTNPDIVADGDLDLD